MLYRIFYSMHYLSHLFLDFMRMVHRYDVTINPPASHPMNSLLAMRLLAATPDSNTSNIRQKLSHALFSSYWTEQKGMLKSRVQNFHMVVRNDRACLVPWFWQGGREGSTWGVRHPPPPPSPRLADSHIYPMNKKQRAFKYIVECATVCWLKKTEKTVYFLNEKTCHHLDNLDCIAKQ